MKADHSGLRTIDVGRPIFSGTREDAYAFVSRRQEGFYVYILCRPNGRPFYVGKGKGNRLVQHELEALREHPIGETNPFNCNVIRKINKSGAAVVYQIDSWYGPDAEQACLIRETELIEGLGRFHEGGPLTNLAGGVGSTSGSSPFSKQKHEETLSGTPENNPERAILNQFLQGVGPVKSVPIKPIGQISRILPTTPHPSPRKPTARCAYALIASAIAHELEFVPGVSVPRKLTYDGVDGIIENGVARDILKAGMAELEPADDPQNEAFRLDVEQISLIIELYGREGMALRGLL